MQEPQQADETVPYPHGTRNLTLFFGGLFLLIAGVIYVIYKVLHGVSAGVTALTAPPPPLIKPVVLTPAQIEVENAGVDARKVEVQEIVKATTVENYRPLAEVCEDAVLEATRSAFRRDFASDRLLVEQQQIPGIVAAIARDPDTFVTMEIPIDVYYDGLTGVHLWWDVWDCTILNNGTVTAKRDMRKSQKFD